MNETQGTTRIRFQELPLVSVVIPVLNGGDDIEGCVRALRAQNYPADRFEILIVDNGSEDGTREAVEALGLHCFVRLERGRSRALNTGLAAARGEIICTIDISCRPVPEWIGEIVKTFENPEVGCVAGEIRLLRTVDNMATRFQERTNYMSAMSAIHRTRAPYFPYADGANASFRKVFFDEVGPFEESFIKAADVEICYRLLFMTDYKIAFNPHALVWEPGEKDLRTLLNQRYRIGIGWVLMMKRFPLLYRELPTRTMRQRYWGAREAANKTISLVVALLKTPFSQSSRERFQDLLILQMMIVAQRLGKRHGRRVVSDLASPPQPIDAQYLEGASSQEFSIKHRILSLSEV